MSNDHALATSEPNRAPATADQTPTIHWDILEQVVMGGDLAKLTPEQRLRHVEMLCEATGLDPRTQPFEYIRFDGKLTLYTRRQATEQLRRIHNVSVQLTSRELLNDGVYAVTARATLPNGRTDESTGVVSLAGLKGAQLANAFMRAETKAKRRVTLSICGLGMLDESELDTMPRAQTNVVNMETGEVRELPPRRQHAPQVPPRQVDPPDRATQEQIAGLYDLSDALGIDRPTFEATLRRRYQVGHPSALTTEQAADAQERLMTALEKRQAADAQRADEDAELARIGELVDAELAATADEEGAS